MSMTDDAKQAHDMIKNPKMMKKIMERAQREGISFNAAMKQAIKEKA